MATNRADTLDPALLRPGRLDRKIEFPIPDRRQKRLVFQVCSCACAALQRRPAAVKSCKRPKAAALACGDEHPALVRPALPCCCYVHNTWSCTRVTAYPGRRAVHEPRSLLSACTSHLSCNWPVG